MAIDTRNKRSSAIHTSSPWRCQLPLADGAIGQADRQHTAWIYSGILAEETQEAQAPGGRFVAMAAYVPGFKAVAAYVPGVKEVEVYVPGFKEVEAY